MFLKTCICFLFCIYGSFALFDESSSVIELNTKNFKELVENGKEIWVVEFHTPGCDHCQKFASDYVKIAEILDGIVKTGAVNCEENPNLIQEYKVSSFPTIKFFNTHKGLPLEYKGKWSIDAIVAEIRILLHDKINDRLEGATDLGFFKSKDIIELTDENFHKEVLDSDDMWLIAFYTLYQESCKTLSPEFLKVASELKGLIKIGSAEAINSLLVVTYCKFREYPAILFFPSGVKDYNSRTEYVGDFKSDKIIKWTYDIVENNTPNRRVTQIVNMESITQACGNKPLCIISFLPHILNCKSQCHNDYLDILTDTAKVLKKFLWGWVWSEGGSQPALEAALEIGDSGYPAIAAVSVKKKKYATFIRSFSVESLLEFLEELAREKMKTMPATLKEMPEIEEVESWDGLDAEEIRTDSDVDDIFFDMKDEL